MATQKIASAPALLTILAVVMIISGIWILLFGMLSTGTQPDHPALPGFTALQA